MHEQQIYEDNSIFKAFPDTDTLSSETEKKHLLPVGLVDFKQFDECRDEKILVAIPLAIPLYENALIVKYSLINGKWKLDDDVELDPDSEDTAAVNYYNKARSFYSRYGFLSGSLDDEANPNDKTELITVGGPVPFGMNWDAELDVSDEMEEQTQGLDMFEDGNSYTYLGMLTEYHYTDGGDTMIVFYDPVKKTVLLTFDHS